MSKQLHYPEEWGPSNDRRLTCSCGHPDPAHRDPKPPQPVTFNACNWPNVPANQKPFRVWKDEPDNEHAPWFVVMPDNGLITLASELDADDLARANWMAAALNAAVEKAEAATLLEQQGAEIERLKEALLRLCRSFPTDTDMVSAGWSAAEIEEGCAAHASAYGILKEIGHE